MENGSILRKLISFLGANDNPDAPKIEYSSDGRSGQVHCKSAKSTFSMYYEFGGGDCVASIDIPSPENWEQATKLPLAQRDELLSFIGRQVATDQVSGGRGYFKIEGKWLNIYAKKD